jgi:hypothetical protein
MSNPVSFMDTYTQRIVQLASLLQDLRGFNDMIDQDATLIDRYFGSPNPRTDIVAADVTDAHDAIQQVLFTYDSGSPTQKAALYKMLP